MKNHDFTTLKLDDGTEMDAYIAIPEGEGKFPGIIVLQEAFGVNHHIQNIAERLCSAGYVAIAPDLFHRTEKRVDIAYTDFPKVMPHLQVVSQEGLTSDLHACYEWLQNEPATIKDKIGSIGFCLGGRVSFLANAILPLSAAVSFYGGGVDKMAGLAEKLHAPQLFFWGGLDKHILQETIDTVIHALKSAGKPYTNVVISNADHGFNCDERQSYHPEAASEAWSHTLAFLANKLKAVS